MMANGHGASEQQYALVSGGAVLCLCGPTAERPGDGDFSDEFPADSKWLPVVDRHPFDVARHCWLAPSYEVNGDCVSRVYQTLNPEPRQRGRGS